MQRIRPELTPELMITLNFSSTRYNPDTPSRVAPFAYCWRRGDSYCSNTEDELCRTYGTQLTYVVVSRVARPKRVSFRGAAEESAPLQLMKHYYVYIISNKSRRLYTAEKRVYEHKNKLLEGFTARYNFDMLGAAKRSSG